MNRDTKPWRWEFAGTPQADSVAVWMQPGHGRPGALHSIVLGLVRKRQSHQAHLEWAYDPIEFVAEEMLAWRSFADQALELLEELYGFGLVEPAPGDWSRWRATELAVEAIEVSYAERHPMTTEGAPEREIDQ